MKKTKILFKILKLFNIDKIVTSFIGFTFLAALGILLVEPTIHTYGDALWFCFTSVTTIGFGDYTAVTFLGRILIVVNALYGILVIALIPGILVSYFTEIMKMKADESIMVFLDKLEHLPELSTEELYELSIKAKERRIQMEHQKKRR